MYPHWRFKACKWRCSAYSVLQDLTGLYYFWKGQHSRDEWTTSTYLYLACGTMCMFVNHQFHLLGIFFKLVIILQNGYRKHTNLLWKPLDRWAKKMTWQVIKSSGRMMTINIYYLLRTSLFSKGRWDDEENGGGWIKKKTICL